MAEIGIKIYTTTTCPYCKSEKEYLDSKGMKYENVFVDQDPHAAEEMINKSGQMGVPFATITKEDGTEVHVLGFDRAKLDQALGIT